MMFNPSLDQPIIFQSEVNPTNVGMSSHGVNNIIKEFEFFYTQGLHPGAQLVILRYGQVVLDRVIGYSQPSRKHKIQPSTPFLVFSISKPFTAMCIHRMIEHGQLELDRPIAHYWPEFGCHAKETATVRHALLHQAGIPIRGLYTQVFLWPFWSAVTYQVANLKAEFPPGTRCAYHLVNFGFILGELVRRVSGSSIREYLYQNIILPLGLNDTRLGLTPDLRGREAGIYWGHVSQRSPALLFSLPPIRQAVVPAATLHSTARDLSIFFQMLLNGGRYAGIQHFAPKTIYAATALGYEGYDETIRTHMRWGMGFALGGSWEPGIKGGNLYGDCSSPRTFGHAGQASSIVWADPDAQVVLAFTCNRLMDDQTVEQRYTRLANALWDALQ
jgi:CubicO group peptidase (beta-lactamase class C family)